MGIRIRKATTADVDLLVNIIRDAFLDVAERFGLIILDDNTVINGEGRLLIQGKKWKDSVPLLPAQASTPPRDEEDPSPLTRPLDLKTSP